MADRPGRRAARGVSRVWSAGLALAVLALLAVPQAATGAPLFPAESGPRKIKPDLKTPPKGTKMYVATDKMTYNSRTKIAVATGRVVIHYGRYILVATRVVYDQRHDRMRANGHVRLREPGGNILEADLVQLRDKFKNGFANHLRLLLTNDSTMTADYAKRRDGYLTVYTKVTYTRCKTCVFEDGTPLWQLRSVEATHNENDKRIYHKDVTLEFAGVPVMWTPYLSHPDPTAKRASGFLVPSFAYSSIFGPAVEIPYFWNLAPNYDITFLPLITATQGPMPRAIWRHRLKKGSYKIDAAGIYQFQAHKISAPGNAKFRGFIRSEGNFDINSRWRWGWDGTYTTDDTYMRRYGINKRTELVSNFFLTGINDRNYFDARVIRFEGLLGTDDNDTYPFAGPVMRQTFVYGEPVFGGELKFDSSSYSLYRRRPTAPFATVNQGERQSRSSVIASWQRRITGQIGMVITPSASLRGDLYSSNKVPDATVASGFRKSEINGRIIPTAAIDIRWPFIKSGESGQHVLTPVVQAVTSTSERKANKFGNEDAITLNFDHSSIFLQDRFTGRDRHEGGTRINAGLLYNWMMPSGGYARFSIGQSFHIGGKNSFVAGSGLNRPRSDIVAALMFHPNDMFRFTYQARFDNKTLGIRAQEAGVNFDYERLTAAVNYADIDAEPAYGRATRQQQLWMTADLKVYNGWSIFGGFRYDLRLDRRINSTIGVGYDCDCYNFKLYYREDRSSDRDAKTGRAVIVSMEFKTLGSSTGGLRF